MTTRPAIDQNEMPEKNDMGDLETIWLKPACKECIDCINDTDYGRTWCQDNIYEPCPDCGRLPTKYTIVSDSWKPKTWTCPSCGEEIDADLMEGEPKCLECGNDRY